MPQCTHVNSHHDLALSRPVRCGGLWETTNAPQSGTGQIDPAATTSSRSSQSSSIGFILITRCVLPLLLRTRHRWEYSRYFPQFLQDRTLSAALRCETDMPSAGFADTDSGSPGCIENASFHSSKSSSEGILIGHYLAGNKSTMRIPGTTAAYWVKRAAGRME